MGDWYALKDGTLCRVSYTEAVGAEKGGEELSLLVGLVTSTQHNLRELAALTKTEIMKLVCHAADQEFHLIRAFNVWYFSSQRVVSVATANALSMTEGGGASMSSKWRSCASAANI